MNYVGTKPTEPSKELVVYYRNYSQTEYINAWRVALGVLYDFLSFAIAHIADPLFLHRFDNNMIMYNALRSLIVTTAQAILTHQFENPNANITGLLIRCVENFVGFYALGTTGGIADRLNLYPTQLETLAYSVGRAFTDVAVHRNYLPAPEEISYKALPSNEPSIIDKWWWFGREIAVNSGSLWLIHFLDKRMTNVPRQVKLNAFTGIWKIIDESAFYLMNNRTQVYSADFMSTATEILSSYIALTVALEPNYTLTERITSGTATKLFIDGALMILFGHQPEYIRAKQNDPTKLF